MDPPEQLLGGVVVPPRIKAIATSHNEIVRVCEVIKTRKNTRTAEIPSLTGVMRIQSMLIQKGVQGFVVGKGHLDKYGTTWREFAIGRTNVTGWVDEKDLHIADEAGQVQIVEEQVELSLNEDTPQFDSILGQSIGAIYTDIMANGDTLDHVGGNLYVIDFLGRRIRKTVSTFMKGMPKDVFEVMRDGKPTIEQLWALPEGDENWITDNDDNRAGIYVILFRNLHGQDGTYGFYIGKSVNLGKRVAGHKISLDGQHKGHMYSRGRTAAEYKFMLLTDLAGVSTPEKHTMLSIAEQTGVSLFDSWTRKLSGGFSKSGLSSRYLFDAEAAHAYSKIARDACSRFGYQAPSGIGLNWKTPLAEALMSHTAFTCHVFTPDEDTGEIRSYRSAPRAVNTVKWSSAGKKKGQQGKTHLVCLLYGGNDARGRINICIEFEDAEDIPSHVNMIVEMHTGEGKRHPVPWVRFPEPGPFEGWEDLNRFGIRYEYMKKDGTWVSAYCQATNGPFHDVDFDTSDKSTWSASVVEALKHVSPQYIKARCLYDTLRQITRYDPSPWAKVGPQIKVKEITYNHLKQIVIIKDQEPKTLPSPRLVSAAQNFVALQAKYGNDVYFKGVKGLMARYIDKLPTHCAMCDWPVHDAVPGWFGKDPHEAKYECPEEDYTLHMPEGLVSCHRCWKLRRPCVWIAHADLFKPQNPAWRYKFLRIPARYMGSRFMISALSSQDASDGPINDEVEEVDKLMKQAAQSDD